MKTKFASRSKKDIVPKRVLIIPNEFLTQLSTYKQLLKHQKKNNSLTGCLSQPKDYIANDSIPCQFIL